MKRREFIAGLGSAAAMRPLLGSAQQIDRVHRIGVLQTVAENDPAAKIRTTALVQGLQELGWTQGRNIHIESRFAGDLERIRAYAAELVAQKPEVLLVQSNPGLTALRQIDRTIPTVFLLVADPVGSHFVDSLARSDGNLTGFTNFEPSIGGKWVEVLKEAVPSITRAAALYHAQTAANVAMLHAAESAGSSLGVRVLPAAIQDGPSAEQAINTFAADAHDGLIVMPHPVTVTARGVIIESARRHRLPAIGTSRYWAAEGSLISYGIDEIDLFHRAASYIDRILRGEKPADLPVQAPTKYELVINLKTAKALDLNIPPTLLARADEVIE
jgi:putative ABC transport system substrate-binding protein